MPSPERMHVIMNAADAVDRFEGTEVQVSPLLDAPTPAQIIGMLALQEGRLFALPTTYDDGGEAVLSVVDSTSESVRVRNRIDPSFEDDYRVADEPPPEVSMPHGDLLFDLVRASTETTE